MASVKTHYMKKILTTLIVFLLAFYFSNATNYFFSTTDGDDSRTNTQAQNSATPWKTLTKLNSIFSTLQPGDHIFFKRGDVFTGNIVVNKSGTSGNPITLGAYGSGARPVINGFTTILSWTSAGSGLYTATVGSLSSCNVVLMDEVFQPMGRMPKANVGYYNVSSVNTGAEVITSNTTTTNNPIAFSVAPSCIGGEVCWRAYDFVFWRGQITAQTSTSVTYLPFAATSGGDVNHPQAGYGFFLQNHPNCCTQLGEWAYNSITHTLTVFFGGAGPSGHTVKAITTDNLVNTSGFNFITLTDLTFQGGNTNVIVGVNSTNITVTNCDIMYGGVYGLFGNGSSSNWSLTNSNISYCNNIGIRASLNSTNYTVSNNYFNQVGRVAGMGGNGTGQYFVIRDMNNNSTITNNTITNSGYVPINFNGKNVLVQYNNIDTFCTILDDGGGIYFGGGSYTGSLVTNNTVLNGWGAAPGTSHGNEKRAFGIYADDGTNGVEISNNTLAYNGDAGIYIHNGHDLNFHDNTCYDNTNAAIRYYNDGNTIKNITLKNNLFFAKTTSEYLCRASGGSNSPSSYFTANSADSNNWYRPINESNTFNTLVPSNQTTNLSGWKSLVNNELHSSSTQSGISNVSELRFESNPSNQVKTFVLDANYILPNGDSWDGTVKPYQSVVLIKKGPSVPVFYYNSVHSATFSKNNCITGNGSVVTYTVPASKYSASTQIAADSLAFDDISRNGQSYANANGICVLPPVVQVTYYNTQQSKTFIKNNCGTGYTPSSVTYTVAPSKYSSTISQADANNKAIADLNTNGQNYANMSGTCIKRSCSLWDKLFKRNGCR
jgi:parallel beta-helix repeat protein